MTELSGLQIFKYLPAAKKQSTQTAKSADARHVWLMP